MSDQLTVPARRETRVVESEIALFDTGKFEHMNRIAVGMASCMLIPEHLAGTRKGNDFTPFEDKAIAANCLLVVNQAARWEVDPFALAQATYVTRGKLGYEGKAIKAVVDARSGIKGGLQFRFNTKQGDDFAVVVFGHKLDVLPDEAKVLLRTLAENDDRSALSDLQDMGVNAVRLSVKQGKTDNQMWQKDPEQKLIYSGSVRWARRYRPDIIMGVKTDDDSEHERESEQLPKVVLQQPPRQEAAQIEDKSPEVLPPVTPTKSAKPKAEKKTPLPKPTEPEPPAPTAEEKPAEPEPAKDPAPAPEPAAEEPADLAGKLLQRTLAAGFLESDLVTVAMGCWPLPTNIKTIAEIPEDKQQIILESWDDAIESLTMVKGKREKAK